MRKVESTTTLRFAPSPLPRNSDVSGGDALTGGENLFGSNEDRAAQIQRGVEQSILRNLKNRSVGIDVWADALDCCKEGVESIVKDSFTECFRPRAPEDWNFGPILFCVWAIGLFFRWFILFPLRVLLLFLGSVVFAIGCVLLSVVLPFIITEKHKIQKQQQQQQSTRKKENTTDDNNNNNNENEQQQQKQQQQQLLEEEEDLEKERRKLQSEYYKRWLGIYTQWWTFVLAIVIKIHGSPPVKRPNQIYVANHTSLIDFIVLKSIVDLASVGQKHTGLVGFIQDRMVSGIWFERFETRQRTGAADLITEWISNEKNDRLLIFPEGVCVNNEYCVMFKKRVFEIENVEICPIAIKYNKSWSDPYWSSKDESFIGHIFRLMRSWCTVCDIWFLEPEKMHEGEEDGVSFANRVKSSIAKRAGLKNLQFDGYLKYYVASEKLGEKRKKLWAEKLLEQFPEIATNSGTTANIMDVEQLSSAPVIAVTPPVLNNTNTLVDEDEQQQQQHVDQVEQQQQIGTEEEEEEEDQEEQEEEEEISAEAKKNQ